MLNIFNQLAKDINGYNVSELYAELSAEAIENFPDIRLYPFDAMIRYAKNNWLNRISRDNLIRDLTMLKKIAELKDQSEAQVTKIGDAIILSAHDDVIDYIVKTSTNEQLKRLFNPISQSAKIKLNESYKRIRIQRSNA